MRAIILSGGIFHDFDRMTAAAAGILAGAGFEAEIVSHPAELAQALARPADLVVVQALRWRMLGHEKYEPYRADWAYEAGADLIAALDGHVARGGGVMALHTGCISFDDWPGWRGILGGGWVWGESFHDPGLEPVTVTPADHPVTQGVAAFTITDELYQKLDLAPGITILAEGRTAGGATHPVVWAHEGQGRAVTITTGHDLTSVTQPDHARLLAQAALWAARAEEGTTR